MENICLISFAYPWFFGPYGKQLLYLIKEYKSKFNIYYLCLELENDNLLSSDSFVDPKISDDIRETIKDVKFFGCKTYSR